MLWASFSYDHKGLFHIWKKETAAQKKAAQMVIDEYSAAHEVDVRIEWTLETAMRRLNLNWPGKPDGRTPVWKFTAARGAMIRTGKAGGIDTIRYCCKVIRPKIKLFAKKCTESRLDTIA